MRLSVAPLGLAVAAMGAVCFGLTFGLYYGTEAGKEQQPSSPGFVFATISRTGAERPESVFFTAALHVGAFLSAPVMAAAHARLRAAIDVAAPPGAVNGAALGLPGDVLRGRLANAGRAGALSVACMFATGSVPLGVSWTLHGLFAGGLFFFGAVYAFLLTFRVLRHVAPAHPELAESYRRKRVVAGGVVLLMVLYVFVWEALQADEDCWGESWCFSRNAKSVTEYALAAAMVAFVGSLAAHEGREYSWGVFAAVGREGLASADSRRSVSGSVSGSVDRV